MRPVFGILHRWIGLTTAGFLFVAGVTGALISWSHEIDKLLNPHLMKATELGAPIASLELARQVEVRDRRVRVTFIPLVAEPGESLAISVQPRVDSATGRLYGLDYDQVFLDPATGEELGRRQYGVAWPINNETLVPFLYVLHYSLHIPEFWGIDRWGLWFMGGIAILWTFDCFVGFYLTLPARRAARADRAASVQRQLSRGWWSRWMPAWKIKQSGSAYRINFDIHRAFGLWTWLLLFILAFTAFSLNLYREIFYPVMSVVSQVTPSLFDSPAPNDSNQPIEPRIDFAEVIEKARTEGHKRGWKEPVGAVFYNAVYGVYGALLYKSGNEDGNFGFGPARLYYDGRDGRYLGDHVPWQGTAADIFVQAQLPLHSGRILGLPGRILVSLMGLIVAALSVTGVVIWYRKLAARTSVKGRVKAPRKRRLGAPAE